MKLILVLLVLAFSSPAFAQWVVTDPANTAVNTVIKGNQIAQHAETMRQWAEQLEKLNRQIRQVEDLLATQRLIRDVMGDPARAGDRVVRRTLGETEFGKSYGETMDAMRRLSDAVGSLRRTADGIYRALDDKTALGAGFARQPELYRRYAAVERQGDNVGTVLVATDADIAAVQSDLAAAVVDLRNAPTQAETEKLHATVDALNGRLAGLAARRSEETDKLLAAQILNENQAEKEKRDLQEKQIAEERQSVAAAKAGSGRCGSPRPATRAHEKDEPLFPSFACWIGVMRLARPPASKTRARPAGSAAGRCVAGVDQTRPERELSVRRDGQKTPARKASDRGTAAASAGGPELMDNFVPGFRESIVALTESLRFVVYFVCVAGLMLRVSRARPEQDSLTQPIVRAVLVVGFTATLPWWFAFTEDSFLTLAEVFHHGYLDHPMQAAALLRDGVTDSGSDFSFQRLGESLYRAFLMGSGKLVVLVASVLQLPLLILHYILKLLCFLFLPVALSMFMLPGLNHLGVRYVQQTLAVLAWPVGFAITELVTWNLLTAYSTNLATAYGLRAGEIDTMSFASLLGALIGAIWLVLGTLGTPILMQMLFCSGSPLSGGGNQGLQQLYSLQQVMWLAKSLKTGGAAAVAGSAAGPTRIASGGGGQPPMPPMPPPTPSPAPVAPGSGSKSDPSGDQAVAALLASTRMPAPQTTC